MAGILDLPTGAPQPSRIGTLSSLATMPLTMPSLTPSIRLGSSTGGLAPGNGWGDAPTSGPSGSWRDAPGALPGGASMPPIWMSAGSLTPAIGGIPTVSVPTPASPQPTLADDGDKGPSTWQRIAGIIGDALLVGTNHQPIFGPAAQAYAKMQPDPADTALKMAQAHAYMRPDHQVVNLGNGGVGQWDSDNGFSMVRQPDPVAAKQTPLEENLATLRKLNPTMTDAQAAAIVQRGMQGYQYDPTYMAQRQANTLGAIDARGTQARTTKGTPSRRRISTMCWRC